MTNVIEQIRQEAHDHAAAHALKKTQASDLLNEPKINIVKIIDEDYINELQDKLKLTNEALISKITEVNNLQSELGTANSSLSSKTSENDSLQTQLKEFKDNYAKLDLVIFNIAQKNINTLKDIASSEHYLKEQALHKIEEKCSSVADLESCNNHRVNIKDIATGQSHNFCCRSDDFLSGIDWDNAHSEMIIG